MGGQGRSGCDVGCVHLPSGSAQWDESQLRQGFRFLKWTERCSLLLMWRWEGLGGSVQVLCPCSFSMYSRIGRSSFTFRSEKRRLKIH